MKKKNLVVGIAAGAALISVALLLSRNSKYNWKSISDSVEDAIDSIKQKVIGGPESDNQSAAGDHGGKHLANKARHRTEHHLAADRNGHS